MPVISPNPTDDEYEDPDEAPELAPLQEVEEQKRSDSLDALGESLLRLFDQYERMRQPIEWRWLEDLRQFEGEYDPEDLQDIVDAGGCQLFTNITKPKTYTFAARMAELLLPTDGKNFGVEPTPVPQLAQAMKDQSQAIDPKTGQPMTTPDGQPVATAHLAKAVKDVAKERADAMEEEIDDQLTESNYNPVVRQSVDQMAKLGTGIAKGPVLTDQRLSSWKQLTVDTGGGTPLTLYKREETPDPRPAVRYVDCWNLYPDMSASTPEGWEGVFEQYLVNKRELRKIARENGFYPDKLQEVIDRGPAPVNNIPWLAEMRSLNGLNNFPDERYRLLQFHGELEPEWVEAADLDMAAMGLDPETDEVYGVIWFCGNTVLKVTLSPLDSGAHPYSLAYCEKDPSGPFGYGIPRLMRSEQRAANSAYRMMHDNAALSVGGQVVMNKQGVIPADGDWRMSPKKIWYTTEAGVKVGDVFGVFNIDSKQQELMNLFEKNRQLADDSTMTPLIAQGDQAPHITKTASGMTILFNAANVVLRRSVKNFDDHFTVPLITRFYEWNMQFNDRPDIKGDYRVKALGSSVLLEKEQEAQQAATALNFGLDSRITPHIDIHKLVEQVFKSWRLEMVVRDPEDYEKERQRTADENKTQLRLVGAQKIADLQEITAIAGPKPPPIPPGQLPGQPAQPDPNAPTGQEQDLAQRKQALAEERLHHDMQKHADDVHLTLMEYALKHNLSLQDAQRELAALKIREDGANQRFNADMQMKARKGSGIAPQGSA